MALPETIRVKLSTEAAGAISITPVVVEEIPLGELIERMLGVTGKSAARIRELLLRGSLVSGASRFRWQGFDAPLADIDSLLAALPEADPSRPFVPARCVRAVLSGPATRIEITAAAGGKRRLFRRRSVWDAILRVAAEGSLTYSGYSYRERADVYCRRLSPRAIGELRGSAPLAAFTRLEAMLRDSAYHSIELFVER